VDETPRTARGRATRERIVAAAAGLMYEHGVAGTSMDDVRLASGTSKSQLYHYFADKTALVCAVVAFQERAVIGDRPFLDDLATLEGLRRWRDQVVRLNGQAATLGGCPVGGLVPETANDERSRQASAAAFESWRAYLADGLRRMQDGGELSPEADPDTLALGLLAALQGGLLMAQAHRSTDPLAASLDLALLAVETQTPRPRAARTRRTARGR
jgi:TetR/AcrR family transcriptional regulator, transcriptional repressor for nem operon